MMSGPENSPQETHRSWPGRVITILAVVPLVAAWTWGQIWRDQTLYTAYCFYIPSPLLVAWLLAIAAWVRSIGHHRAAICTLILAIAPLAMVLLYENQWSRPTTKKVEAAHSDTIRIVHWNVKNGDRGWESITDKLLEQQADAYFVSEPPFEESFDRFEGFEIVKFHNMVALLPGEVLEQKSLAANGSMFAFVVEWQCRGADLRVAMADIGATLSMHREPRLNHLNRLLLEDGPDLLLGDLNSPRRSRELHPPAEGYQHAYEAAGSGWSYTWPVPLPVYAIDQMLFGRRVNPLRYELVTSRLSDHRMQIFEFQLKQPSEQ